MGIILHMIEPRNRVCRQNHYKVGSLLIGLLLLCTHTNAWCSKPGNSAAEKVIINADRMFLNIESGNSTYTGNVKISQGELVLTGEKVTLKQKNNEIERITVIGKPAKYNHVTEKGETVKAESGLMVYTASENRLVMTINAKLHQPDYQISSQKITYDTVKRIVIAGDNNDSSANKSTSDTQSSADEKQRVNITLTPKKQIIPDSYPSPETTPRDNAIQQSN